MGLLTTTAQELVTALQAAALPVDATAIVLSDSFWRAMIDGRMPLPAVYVTDAGATPTTEVSTGANLMEMQQWSVVVCVEPDYSGNSDRAALRQAEPLIDAVYDALQGHRLAGVSQRLHYTGREAQDDSASGFIAFALHFQHRLNRRVSNG